MISRPTLDLNHCRSWSVSDTVDTGALSNWLARRVRRSKLSLGEVLSRRRSRKALRRASSLLSVSTNRCTVRLPLSTPLCLIEIAKWLTPEEIINRVNKLKILYSEQSTKQLKQDRRPLPFLLAQTEPLFTNLAVIVGFNADICDVRKLPTSRPTDRAEDGLLPHSGCALRPGFQIG